MDIEQIEEYITGLYSPVDFGGASEEDLLRWIQSLLLLHIYRKLDDIDGSLGAIYSELGEIRAALPGKW